jgi:hypothetical protein
MGKVDSHVVIVAKLPSSHALLQLETKKTKNKLLGFFLANAKRLSLCQPQRLLSLNF